MPFARSARFRSGEIGKAGARMGIDHPDRRRFAVQVRDHAGEDDMFVDVGEITGVKSMAVVHSLDAPGTVSALSKIAIIALAPSSSPSVSLSAVARSISKARARCNVAPVKEKTRTMVRTLLAASV